MEDESNKKRTGKVHSFSGGYGYIIGDDGLLYFVHVSGIDLRKDASDDDEPLHAGDAVEFSLQDDPEGCTAIDVRKTRSR